MEDVGCLLCGSRERRIKYRGSDRLTQVPGEFTLVECLDCGFLYLSPRPDAKEIDRFYSDSYSWAPAQQETSAFMRKAIQTENKQLAEVILKRVSGGSLLDVGCAVGDFLAAVRAHPGWEVRGLEPSPTLAQRAIDAYGLEIDQDRLENAPYSESSFDVVTLWEVLEHLPYPRDALRQIHALLRPGGAIVMSLPDRNSFEARLFGPSWVGLDIPRHFSVFSQHHITQALTEAGFDQIDIFTLPGPLGTAHHGLQSLMLSFYIWSQGDGSPGKMQRAASAVLKPVARRPLGILGLFLLSAPFQQISRVRSRGSSMAVVARRK